MFFILFFFPSRIFDKKRGEKSNQKISRKSSERIKKRTRTFCRLSGWIKKNENASYKHTAFDVNLDRKQK